QYVPTPAPHHSGVRPDPRGGPRAACEPAQDAGLGESGARSVGRATRRRAQGVAPTRRAHSRLFSSGTCRFGTVRNGAGLDSPRSCAKGGDPMKKTLMAMALVLATAGAALANQCPLLIKQIEDATAGKTHRWSNKAQALAK